MPVDIWCFTRSNKSHENKALLHLADELNALEEWFLMICNPVLEGQEIDALVFKRNMLFVVELKSVNGPITGNLYGEWTVEHADGSTHVVNGGRERNPFWQVQNEHWAAVNFFTEHKTDVMTTAEAAQNDFKRIKNVLILDPDYDPAASQIDLEDKGHWIEIVGLHGRVAEPFWTLSHKNISMTIEQMQAFARDVLHCTPYVDLANLVNGGDTAVDPEEEVREMTTLEEVVPDDAAPGGLRGFLNRILGGALPVIETQIQRVTATPVEFGDIVYGLREAADKSVHQIPPETLVANYYQVELDSASYNRLAALKERYQKRAQDDLREHIAAQRYIFDERYDRLTVVLTENPSLTHRIAVSAGFQEVPPAVILTGPEGITYRLYAGEAVQLGRGDRAAWRIPDHTDPLVASRLHCTIEVSPDGKHTTVRDDDSLNGTWINGAKTDIRAEIKDGDIILLGRNKADAEGPKIYVQVLKPEPSP